MPQPLRGSTAETIWGLPGLSVKDQARVRGGNRTCRFAVEVVRACLASNMPVILENPSGSRLWKAPPLEQALKKGRKLRVTHCAFGTPWMKPTALGVWNIDLDLSDSVCRPCRRKGCCLCSFSGRPHMVLSGRGSNSGFKTAMASAYPRDFCLRIVKEAEQQVKEEVLHDHLFGR